MARRLPPVEVRVEFRIERDGTIANVRASARDAGDAATRFEAVSAETVASWSPCHPATRLAPVGGTGTRHIIQAVPYETWVVFVFEVDEPHARRRPMEEMLRK